MTYSIERRTRPASLQRRRRILGLPIGAKQDYERPWMLLKDGKPVGYYATEEEARAMQDDVEAVSA